jgi:hypothetical protein
MRRNDGSAGDADYGAIGIGYSRFRQPDPRIAAFIHRALGDARSVLNVGAGAGSYEPADREVTAVEPSASMRAQRPAHLPEAVDAVAEHLPFPDQSFDAAMATFTIHQWPDLAKGLAEIGPVPIPLDCRDGLNEAYYGRPELLLDPAARLACSAWSFVDASAVARFEADLARDLADGTWDACHGALRKQATFEGSLVLIVG